MTVGFVFGSLAASAFADDPPGRKLFVERWSAHDKRSLSGDGLGPLHNATSCAACHHQGGPGGGGNRQFNVQLLSLVPVDPRKTNEAEFTKRLLKLHPGFASPMGGVQPNIVLHRFGAEADYFDFRAKILGIEEPRPDVEPGKRAVLATALAKRRRKMPSVEPLPPVDGISFNLSQRNTPALWGAGLIDSIPDAVIQQNADVQRRESPEVAGRVPRATGGGVGRFGWRGQTATLQQFVMIACANELGLQTKDHPQALSPLTPDYRPGGEDMSERDADEMVRFVANLPRPIEAVGTTPLVAERIRSGAALFERIGCAACHPRELGRVEGLFSDLLLHDMGSELSDPVEPNPDVALVPHVFHGYSGTGSVFLAEEERRDPSLPRQWRTPPLWGVGSSAPYLHDGRAETLADAIAEHGGQGASSVAKFKALSTNDRVALIVFLESLQAPPQPVR
jgi:CxxC motif-containing protein (DUF1111 family)